MRFYEGFYGIYRIVALMIPILNHTVKLMFFHHETMYLYQSPIFYHITNIQIFPYIRGEPKGNNVAGLEKEVCILQLWIDCKNMLWMYANTLSFSTLWYATYRLYEERSKRGSAFSSCKSVTDDDKWLGDFSMFLRQSDGIEFSQLLLVVSDRSFIKVVS